MRHAPQGFGCMSCFAYVYHCVLIPPFVRHEAALWRSDRQHLSGEDHQPGEADRDLQPGRSESRQGSVSTLKALFICGTQCLPPE